MIKVSANIFSEHGGKRHIYNWRSIRSVLGCLDEDILYNKFQEQIENDLEEVIKLEKHVILVNYYFVAYFTKNFVCFSLLSFSHFQIVNCPCFEV